MNPIRKAIRKTINMLGYDIKRMRPGLDPFRDMKRLLGDCEEPVVFDVGANVGQTVSEMKEHFPSSRIHSFEPSPSTFEELKANIAGEEGVSAWNCAMGASPGRQVFRENICSAMSSFLEPSWEGDDADTRETVVEVDTIDGFCANHDIPNIDVLKSDTQGYELEVFKGAEETLGRNGVGMIFCEIIFSEMYRGLPSYDEICRYLSDNGMLPVAFYQFHFKDNAASWCNALFVNERLARRVP